MAEDLQGNIDGATDDGEITTKKGLMAINLSSVAAREWLQKRRESIQPWSEFLKFSSFSLPKSLTPLPKRVVSNIERFQSNYLFVFIILVAFCVLTSPLLLVAIAACLGACYIISVKNADKKIVILGKELSVAHQYTAIGILSFPLFWLAGAGSAVFWVIGASFFVIMLHASLYKAQQDQESFDLEMEEV